MSFVNVQEHDFDLKRFLQADRHPILSNQGSVLTARFLHGFAKQIDIASCQNKIFLAPAPFFTKGIMDGTRPKAAALLYEPCSINAPKSPQAKP